MRVRKDGALDDGVRVASAQAEGEPVANGVSDGVAVACDDETVLIFTDDLLELALSLVRIKRISRRRQSASVQCPCQNGREAAVARGHSWTSRTGSDLGMGWLTRCVKHTSNPDHSRRLLAARSVPQDRGDSGNFSVGV